MIVIPPHAVVLMVRAAEQFDDLSAARRMIMRSARFDRITYMRLSGCLLDRHGFTSSLIKPLASKERIGVTAESPRGYLLIASSGSEANRVPRNAMRPPALAEQSGRNSALDTGAAPVPSSWVLSMSPSAAHFRRCVRDQ